VNNFIDFDHVSSKMLRNRLQTSRHVIAALIKTQR